MKLKRYLVFTHEPYWPTNGGASELKDSFDELEEAKTWFKSNSEGVDEVMDSESGEVVYQEANGRW